MTAYEVPINECFGSAIAAAPAQGVLVRLCEEPRRRSAAIANLRPDGSLVRLGRTESRGGPILAGPSGEVWATGYAGKSVEIYRIAPDGGIDRFEVASEEEFGSQIFIRGLVITADGALWAATGEEQSTGYGYAARGGELVRITSDSTVTHFRVPEEIEPQGLALGPDGNLWFSGVRGRFSAEHSVSAGVGFVGRMTPAGKLTVFRPPGKGTKPGPIAAGPEGRLWFVETGTQLVSTIAVDGSFGPRYELRAGWVDGGRLEGTQGEIVFGPEDDAWISGSEGLIRMTPTGQQTLFRRAAGEALAVGPEGDIWSAGYGEVVRLSPGAPGIDISGLVADRSSHTLSVDLACGGSHSACTGTLDLVLRSRTDADRKPAPKARRFRVVHTTYSVEAESSRTLKLEIAARTFVLGRRSLPSYSKRKPILRLFATATVAGGPTLERKLEARVGA